jgi:drug/metabolite transporter (DMT)-like permease
VTAALLPDHLGLAILAGLGGMVGWGVADFFAKKTIDEVGDVTTLFWGQLLGVVPLGMLFFLKPELPQLSGLGWLWLAVLGVWSGLSYIPTYVAFGKGQVSLLSPIFASYAVVVALLSALVLHEGIPAGRWIAFAVVFLGVLLINGDRESLSWVLGRKREHARIGIPGLKEILLAICLYSAWLIALDRFVEGRDWVPLLLVIRVFSALSLFCYARVWKIPLRVAKPPAWKYLLLIGLFDVAAFAAVTLGFSETAHASVVAMLSGAFSLPTILLAHLFLKERMTRTQAIGSMVSVGGVVLVYALSR